MTAVKCVVWDLDNTLWHGIAVEAPEGSAPPVDSAMLAAIDVLEGRGIVNSVASRTDASILALLRVHPQLADRFVAPQLSWEDKSVAISVIADELGIDTTAIAFVDDSAFERAEVTARLPDVRVFAPDEFLARLDGPDFSPEVITDDSRQRARRYRQEAARRGAGRAFAGAPEAFLRSSDIRVDLHCAQESDIDRLVELILRTHRLNTTGEQWSPERVHQAVGDASWFVPVARLTDRFGDYGLVGAAFVDRSAADVWWLRLFAVSCRAAGRGVPAAFLSRLLAAAHAAGAGRMLIDIRPGEANLELRVLLRGAGFAAEAAPTAGELFTLQRATADEPPVATWLTITEGY